MNKWKKQVLINVTIVAVLLFIDLLLAKGNKLRTTDHVYLPQFVFSGIMILLLAPINFITGMIRNRNRKGDGPIYLLISGLLLLIGFSVCTI